MKRLLRVGTLAALAVVVAGGCTTEVSPPELAPSAPAFIPPPPFPTGAPFPAGPMMMNQQPTEEFKGKFVAINYVLGDDTAAAIMHSPTVKKLGSRDFLVGEIVGDGRTASAEKKSISAWVPVDSIDSLLIFETKEQAVREANDAVGARM